MTMFRRWFRTLSTNAPSRPRTLPTKGFQILDSAQKLEEETLPWYRPDRFYPVRLGEVFESRYQVLTKLGYGSCSTAWLCRNLIEHKYVALKVCLSNYPSVERESAAYTHLRQVLSNHPNSPGSKLVRASIAEFEVPGVEGPHRCFVFDPLTIDLVATEITLGDADAFDEAVFKTIAVHVFQALDFLHTKAQMVHADLRAENFYLSPVDDFTFRKLETIEMETRPSPRKIDGERIIYDGVGQALPQSFKHYGHPVLCDFGEARFGKESYTEGIQPFMYQAPEVVLDIPWSYPADIWNAGLMLWELYEGKKLLSGANEDKKPSYTHLIAEMVGLMGLPPAPFLARSPNDPRELWFDNVGKWSEHRVVIPELVLDDAETTLKKTGKDSTEFLNFMRRILVWEPEKRPAASELLKDPWLANVSTSSTLL